MKEIIGSLAVVLATAVSLSAAEERPNILWITSEDNGPHLGCYGDKYADTPNLDRLAARGMIYRNAWSNAPVCAPARTTIIAGMYATSTGAQHMRSMTRLPEGMKMYPQYLREAGYYCTNNRKEDYNLQKPGKVWDESSGKAHWKNRKPGQPFFAIFNHTVSHESQIRRRPHKQVHDPAKVQVPAYHPDTPEVRQDWAQYYDKLTEMDQRVGQNLKELRDAGLADETIIFYYGDHGSGMPRSKRWPYNSGLHVPLIVYVPEKFRDLAPEGYEPGGKSEAMVSFVDLAPTLLSLAGIEPPEHMQGRAFLGEHRQAARRYNFGFRGRMDERYDMVRSVRDGRYVYIRNYMPHRIYGQYVSYMFQTPTTQVWKRLYDAGELSPPKTYFWQRKPPEELYDLENDPDEVNNLADSPAHRQVLNRFRGALRGHILQVRDLGFLPEGQIHSRSAGSTPYQMGHDEAKYPLPRILTAAETASSLEESDLPKLIQWLGDEDGAVRYWAAMGILMRGREAVTSAHASLTKALGDEAPIVRVVAAEALARYGDKPDLDRALSVLVAHADLDKHDVFTAMAALNVLDKLDERAASVTKEIRALPERNSSTPGRYRSYVPRLLKKTLADLDA